jgi:hypothetical protein
MKSVPASKPGVSPKAARQVSKPAVPGLIHPVVIYPYQSVKDYADLEGLYRMVAGLAAQPELYARPITVLDRKTHYAQTRSTAHLRFRQEVMAPVSDILDAWCVDTCQMWYCGLGAAWERGGANDVYWLIPGDFNYGSVCGREVLGRLHDLPEICLELSEDLCIGEIAANRGHSKELIDTYGTFALLYNWFQAEAKEIRLYTERPRSEFFAVRHAFLGQMLNQRWYAYEQTVVFLLQAMFSGKRVTRFSVGDISDLPEGGESFASALQQVERTERVLKSVWRERYGGESDWRERYRRLEGASEQIRWTAMNILGSLLS